MYYIFENWSYDDYNFFYKLILGFFILFSGFVLHLSQNNRRQFLFFDKSLLLLMVFFLVFFSGTRGLTIGSDTGNYYNFFYLKIINLPNLIDKWGAIETDLLFKFIFVITNTVKSYYFFLFIVTLIINWAFYYFIRKYTSNGRVASSLFLFLMFMSSFSMISIQINIIRSGLSIVIFLIALYFFLIKQNRRSILFFLISFFFHSTILIPIFSIIFILLIDKILSIKYYYYLFAIAILLSFLEIQFSSLDFLQQSNFENMQKLTTKAEHEYYITGFRLDFVLYNSFFLFLFYKFSKMSNPVNIFLIKIYIINSIFFFLSFNVPHSDRIGIFSWIIIPLLLFNMINANYKRKKLTKHMIVVVLFFILNQLILF